MILTLHVQGTVVKKQGEALSVYIPPEQTNALRKNPPGNKTGINTGKKNAPDKNTSTNTNKNTSKNTTTQSRNTTNKPTKIIISMKKLTSVVISGRISITTPALFALAKNAIPIIFIEKNEPIAILNPYAAHGSVLVRKKQINAINSKTGINIAKKIVTAATENKTRFLMLLAKNRRPRSIATADFLKSKAIYIRKFTKFLSQLTLSTNINTSRATIMGIEGDCTRIYFQAIQTIIPNQLGFSGRNRRPPKDPVNAMLSLGYAILKGFVTMATAATGLEPFAGFLHADRSGKPSLVLDLMETFRQPIIDRTVISLCNKRTIKPKHFETTTQGTRLTTEGKNIFYPAIIKKLGPQTPNELERSSSRNFYKDIMNQARSLARFLLGMQPRFNPFIMTW
ncbi:MAG: CRISPR-associated endonuclease Cas1 [Promethearchaeota archaeon]